MASDLLLRAQTTLPEWLPGGKFRGDEYVCADISGGQGESLKYNILKGTGKDFATGETFGDMIDLYAKIHRISMKESYLALSTNRQFDKAVIVHAKPKPPKDLPIVKPPREVTLPLTTGSSHVWFYSDENNDLLFIIARFDTDGKKSFVPYCWDGTKWVNRHWPAPRPLYGIELLKPESAKPVLIVEGEKACTAARKLLGAYYICMTWACGAQAWNKADFTPIHGRKVLLWPDNDEAGIKAMDHVGDMLLEHCPEVKVLDVSSNKLWPDGADAADYTGTTGDLIGWAKNIVKEKNRRAVEVLPRVGMNEAPENSRTNVSSQPDSQIVPTSVTNVTNNILVLNSEEGISLFDGPPPEGVRELLRSYGLTFAQGGSPHGNMGNIYKILTNDRFFRGCFYFEEFENAIYYKIGDAPFRQWEEIGAKKLLQLMQSEFRLHSSSKDGIYDAVEMIANQNVRNGPKEYLNSLIWDGKSRIKTFLHDYLKAEKSEYTAKVGRNFFVSSVARIMSPGCPVHSMMTLVSDRQGTGKSRTCSILGGQWYLDSGTKFDDKDFLQGLRGKWLIEISELSGLRKADDESIKKVITCASDNYRPSYGRLTANHPRQCVFVGTTNTEFLRDHTGNRRHWPVTIGELDADGLMRDRDQLFAEAMNEFNQSVDSDWLVIPEELIAPTQLEHMVIDPWYEDVAAYCNGSNLAIFGPPQTPKRKVMVNEILDKLGIDMDRRATRDTMRVIGILRQLGYKKIPQFMEHGVKKRYWLKSEE